MPPVDEDYLPATMLERFSGKSLSERMRYIMHLESCQNSMSPTASFDQARPPTVRLTGQLRDQSMEHPDASRNSMKIRFAKRREGA
jgi:hypothetical protein